jgi:hypothetical protein
VLHLAISPAVKQAAALGAAEVDRYEHDVADAQRRLQAVVDTANDEAVSCQMIGDALDVRRGPAHQRFRRRPQPPRVGLTPLQQRQELR